jgi:hypothetical protein
MLDLLYYTRQKNVFGAMEPNVKLMFDELSKQIRVEIKDGFTMHEVAFTKRFDEVVAAEQIRDARITNLKDTAAALDKSFVEWRSEVDSSITFVKLELSKMNSFFDRDARVASSALPVVLPIGLATAQTSVGANADGPIRHHVETSHRDGGFGRVFTQTHIPVMGTMLPPIPPLLFPAHTDRVHASLGSPNFRMNW